MTPAEVAASFPPIPDDVALDIAGLLATPDGSPS